MPERKATIRVSSEEVQGDESFVLLRRLKVRDARKAADAAKEKKDDTVNLEILATSIIEWNWVDDDGKPMPLPGGKAEALDELTDQELAFLVDSLRGGPDAEKVKN